MRHHDFNFSIFIKKFSSKQKYKINESFDKL